MMRSQPSLLNSPAECIEVPAALQSCLNSQDLYNSFQSVLRRSPEVLRKHQSGAERPLFIMHCVFDGSAEELPRERAYRKKWNNTYLWS